MPETLGDILVQSTTDIVKRDWSPTLPSVRVPWKQSISLVCPGKSCNFSANPKEKYVMTY